MTGQYRSHALASIHETADGLRAAGVMDKQTMCKFDEACLTPVRPLTDEEFCAPLPMTRHGPRAMPETPLRHGHRIVAHAICGYSLRGVP
jgi:hypothetical protein